ncbi:hypothetical protein DW322_04525 [Rhodococcus rhodnii]|uniref:Uncharacterized protein n=2 Tax=Rhodococcus rhodnii TaxID=38312 RepID=R7WGQ4_9NOCA|nr:hypothetical protein [Rhodococcus rhodnii]EOM74218.1 hypothetical protein Rrhod_4361 [Rhodococcus rhodnii LMG 5362]TXG89624.1 hypothetical protein DW322_04525 [Rhodococcus rhodnii]
MARVRKLEKGIQRIQPHTSEVDCFYNVVLDGEDTLLHLTTFGSDLRQSKPKSSQSIQIDEKMAQQLVELMRNTFPSIP